MDIKKKPHTPGIITNAILPIRKEEHVCFLREMFDSEPGQPVKIDRHQFAGRFIFALRNTSRRRVKQNIPDGMIPVPIIFPDTKALIDKERHAYFTIEHIEQINDYISAAFDLFFHIYFFDIENLEGGEEFENTEITKQMLVDSFVMGLGMDDFARASENIKKREYRKSLRILEQTAQKLRKKDYRLRKSIYERRKKYLQNTLFQKDTSI